MLKYSVPYTICFCISNNKVLLMHRNRFPTKGLWNGIGGKIEQEEKPFNSVRREVMEEAEIDLNSANFLVYHGVINWSNPPEKGMENKGIYTFVAYFNDMPVAWKEKELPEGTFEWKDLFWINSQTKITVVDNLCVIYPYLLKNKKPFQYFCDYKNEVLQKVDILPLPKELLSIY